MIINDENIPRLVEKRQTGGHALYYWNPGRMERHGFKMVPLGKDETTAVAQAKLLNTKVDQWKGGQPVLAKNTHGTLPWLIEQYKQGVDYYELEQSTKVSRKCDFARILRWSAERRDPPMRTITRADAEALWRQIHEIEGKPTRAKTIIIRCRTLWNWAIERDLGVADKNPFNIDIKEPPQREQVWSKAQLETFVEQVRSTPVLLPTYRGSRSTGLYRCSIADAIIIARYTCLREGDIIALNWSQYDGKYLTVTPSKTRKTTGVTVRIPVVNDKLCEVFERRQAERCAGKVISIAGAMDGPILINEKTGRRWNNVSFKQAFRRLARKLGLPDDLQFRDLRRTGATALAEAGCSPHEIAAIGGWPPHSRLIAKVYAKANPNMAENAIAKAEAYEKRLLEA